MAGNDSSGRTWRRALPARRLAVIALVLAGVLAAAGATIGTGSNVAQSSQQSSVYWGALIGRHLTGKQPPWNMSAVSVFESHAGKRMSLLEFGIPWRDCTVGCGLTAFPTPVMTRIRARGTIPVIDWASYSYPNTTDQAAFSLSAISGGRYDPFLRRFAKAAKAWGHPFFLRFDWEMNLDGAWTWSEGSNGNVPGDYVRMWRHVHDVFAAAGASNVNWIWCPNRVEDGDIALSELYPGDRYVDWVCMDGYNWGTNPSYPRGWMTFDQVFAGTYAELRKLAPSKPIMIGETASSELGGSKPDWITDALGAVGSRYPEVKALVWFDAYADGMDWPIETSASAQTAFAAGIGAPVYATNGFSKLAGPKIPPLAPLP